MAISDKNSGLLCMPITLYVLLCIVFGLIVYIVVCGK